MKVRHRMPYQNRVNPAGELLKIADRGTFMGNRGILHDESGNIVKKWTIKAWVCCLTEFRGRQRQVFTPRRFSELFFLDEATALSAGHRPCGECRYRDYVRFKELWLQANAAAMQSEPVRIAEIDAVLHRDRVQEDRQKRTYRERLDLLPDGVFIHLPDRQALYLVRGKNLYTWSPGGYTSKIRRSPDLMVDVLTPRSIVNTLKAGYEANVHASINNL